MTVWTKNEQELIDSSEAYLDVDLVVGFRLFDDLGYDLIVPLLSVLCYSEAADALNTSRSHISTRVI